MLRARLFTITFRPLLNLSKQILFRLSECGDSIEVWFLFLQVNEIYHDHSLGARINVVLVRIVLVDAKKVNWRVTAHAIRSLYSYPPQQLIVNSLDNFLLNMFLSR